MVGWLTGRFFIGAEATNQITWVTTRDSEPAYISLLWAQRCHDVSCDTSRRSWPVTLRWLVGKHRWFGTQSVHWCLIGSWNSTDMISRRRDAGGQNPALLIPICLVYTWLSSVAIGTSLNGSPTSVYRGHLFGDQFLDDVHLKQELTCQHIFRLVFGVHFGSWPSAVSNSSRLVAVHGILADDPQDVKQNSAVIMLHFLIPFVYTLHYSCGNIGKQYQSPTMYSSTSWAEVCMFVLPDNMMKHTILQLSFMQIYADRLLRYPDVQITLAPENSGTENPGIGGIHLERKDLHKRHPGMPVKVPSNWSKLFALSNLMTSWWFKGAWISIYPYDPWCFALLICEAAIQTVGMNCFEHPLFSA